MKLLTVLVADAAEEILDPHRDPGQKMGFGLGDVYEKIGFDQRLRKTNGLYDVPVHRDRHIRLLIQIAHGATRGPDRLAVS